MTSPVTQRTVRWLQHSNRKGIMQSILDLAVVAPGVPIPEGMTQPFSRTRKYEIPTADQLNAGGYPYLVVRFPQLVGYAKDGTLMTAATAARPMGRNEPVWKFDLYAIYKYDEDYADQVFETADDAMWAIYEQLYALPTLNRSCATSYIDAPSLGYLRLVGNTSITAKMSIVAFEFLQVQPDITANPYAP